MSYDIYLRHPVTNKVLEADTAHDLRGGTYQLGGSRQLWLNVTYNYGKHYYATLGEKGIRSIYGMTGADSVPMLEQAAGKLGTDVSDDYWEPTEGNARAALHQLISLAKIRPDGIWDGD